MERGGEIGELQDWEVLHNADPALPDSSDSVETHGSFSGIEGDAEGMIRSDYFSLENQGKYGYAKSEEGSIESDNPSWIDPVSVTPYVGKESGGFWSDSASDRSDDRKSNDFEVRSELGFAGNEKRQVAFGETEAVDDNSGILGSREGKLSGLEVEGKVSFEEIGEVGSVDKDSAKFWSDSGRESLVSVKFDEGEMGSSDLDRGINLNKEPADDESAETQEEVKSMAKSGGEGEKRMVLWWKVPLEVLKYCVFKVSPVWSFSVAAAVMGLVILGRRLYRMKRKSQSLQLKVALDDKVSYCNLLLANLITIVLHFMLLYSYNMFAFRVFQVDYVACSLWFRISIELIFWCDEVLLHFLHFIALLTWLKSLKLHIERFCSSCKYLSENLGFLCSIVFISVLLMSF